MDNLMLNDIISFYRKKQGLTQEELAVKLGVTNQAVSKWESAQCCPDINLIPMIADIFQISIDELFGKKPRSAFAKCPTGIQNDPAFSQAMKIVSESGVISTSLLQRELNIGYEQAVHLTDLLKDKVISIDERSSLFSWPDDDTFRVFVAQGKRILSVNDMNDLNGSKLIDIRFPKNCNETTRQYFKVEVFGNICSDASINGDVVCHGRIDCHQINGDIISEGDIYAYEINACGNVACKNLIKK